MHTIRAKDAVASCQHNAAAVLYRWSRGSAMNPSDEKRVGKYWENYTVNAWLAGAPTRFGFERRASDPQPTLAARLGVGTNEGTASPGPLPAKPKTVALRRTVDSLGHDIEPVMTEDWIDIALLHRALAQAVVLRFVRDGILGDAATSESSSEVVLPHSREKESSTQTAVQASRPIVTESS
ncbi:hypothetical protein BGY98DRAFT_1175431 [Russula aff. rugulosa BPL654]|nr:hypothetical protein BGY98DRAFT_1175431 [Russula aff. rugulosa BPL654]